MCETDYSGYPEYQQLHPPFSHRVTILDLLFHTGPRRLFPLVSRAVARIMPLERLQWISFGHYESDECGSMNDWLAVAPGATIAHTAIGCLVSINDMADREPRPLQHGEIIDLGGKQVRHLSTPHVPHGWDAGLLFEESTATLFCGDLFTQVGPGPALVESDILGPAIATEDMFHSMCLGPNTGPAIRSLAQLAPRTLAIMHGPSFRGDAASARWFYVHDHDLGSQRRRNPGCILRA